MKRLSGEFEVKLEPLPESLKTTPEYQTSRFALRKTFHGAMQATSVGEMLAAGSLGTGAGAYVAIDLVTAEIEGRKGTFVLTHVGTRTKTNQHLSVDVVPHSGTDDLSSLTGKLTIRIEGGKHFYDFDYSLT